MSHPDRRRAANPDRPLPRSARPPSGRVTFEEYLAFERRHPFRHEFVDGYVYAMAGAKLRHNRIVGNAFAHLWTLADGAACAVYIEAAKLRVGDDLFYPDVMVSCEPGQDAEEAEMAFAPCLLIEVLSPSTAQKDRSLKLLKYRPLPSLLAYLIVSQRDRHVVRHWREAPDAPWQEVDVVGSGEVPVSCPVAGVLTLDQIYRGLSFGPRLRRVRERAAAAAAAPSPVGA